MAIAIEGFSVVGLKSRIEDKFEGGLAALSKIVPNATEFSDDDLWRCSFMTMADAERFLNQTQQGGLNATEGPDSDIVLVDEFDQSVTPYCEWLQVAQWDKGVVAWRVGTIPRTIIAREGWSPERGSGLEFSSRNAEHLEFRRLDGNVAVYFDKRQNREVYVGQTAPDPDEVYQAASQVILDHCIDLGQPKLTGDAAEKVRTAIASLEIIVQQFPDAWRVHFSIGKGYLAVGELNAAYRSFRRTYDIEKETEAVPRELAGVCLELGKAGEAVEIGQKAAVLKPDNVESLSNLGCAYLVAGRLTEAGTTINAALKLNVTDPTCLLLQRLLDDIVAGSLRQPKTLSDLMRAASQCDTTRQSPRKPIWSRLQFWKWLR